MNIATDKLRKIITQAIEHDRKFHDKKEAQTKAENAKERARWERQNGAKWDDGLKRLAAIRRRGDVITYKDVDDIRGNYGPTEYEVKPYTPNPDYAAVLALLDLTTDKVVNIRALGLSRVLNVVRDMAGAA